MRLLRGDRRWRSRRATGPSAGIVDSRSAKTTGSGDPRGFDAGKKVKGRKRRIVTDTGGLLVGAPARPANIRDRGGAYAGPKLKAALEGKGRWRIEVVG